MTKRVFSMFTALVLAISIIGVLPVVNAAADDTVKLSFDAPFNQTEARKMTKMINDFRQESGVWAWNEDNTEKTDTTGVVEEKANSKNNDSSLKHPFLNYQKGMNYSFIDGKSTPHRISNNSFEYF